MSARLLGAAAVVVALCVCGAVAAQQPVVEPCPPREPCGTGVIAGRVVAADTGQPIEDAFLRLVSFDVMRVARSVVTDAQGRFEYPGLLAGRYQLDLTASPGFLALQYGQRTPMEAGKPIDLANGQRIANADFTVPRAGAIEGTLIDEFGDPAPNVHVEVSRAMYAAGAHRLMAVPGVSRMLTDDKGRYRASGLPPGDYYVSASSGAFADPNAAGGFAGTYHSGSTEVSATKPVRLPVGRELTSVSFGLVPARTSRVGGTLRDQTGQPVNRGTMLLSFSDRGTLTRIAQARSGTNPDGSFLFRNVPPGTYYLEAFGNAVGGGNLARSPFASTTIVVNGEDRTDLSLTVVPGGFARGTIVFERTIAARELRPDDIRMAVGIVALDDGTPTGAGPNESIVNPDWTFSISNISGSRVLRVDVRPVEWAVKRVTLAGKDVTDAPLDFRKGDVNGLEVVLTDAVSSVGGKVLDENRQTLTNYSVIVFSADGTKWVSGFPPRFIQLARPNQDGSFRATRLPPDNYLVVALPTVQGMEWQDPELLEKLRSIAIPVTVNEGDAKTIELRLSERPENR